MTEETNTPPEGLSNVKKVQHIYRKNAQGKYQAGVRAEYLNPDGTTQVLDNWFARVSDKPIKHMEKFYIGQEKRDE